jgi:ABC-type multidrug transport system fused ATPase/permease subunit
MIEFQDVKLSYNNNLVADGMSFSMQFYEKIAILGSSGVGKPRSSSLSWVSRNLMAEGS